MKTFNQAPLPFQGQKRKFIKEFKEALKEFPNDAVYIDLFGGSGLLSHAVKLVYPNARVVWNDFDNYAERLANISKTNQILADIREILKDYPYRKRIDNHHRERILERLRQEQGFVDWITISSSLLFSAKYITNFEGLSKQTLYNNIKQSNYDAEGYLQGVERVQMDYRDLFAEFSKMPNVVYLLDPDDYETQYQAIDEMEQLALKIAARMRFDSNNINHFLCGAFQKNTLEIRPVELEGDGIFGVEVSFALSSKQSLKLSPDDWKDIDKVC